MDWNRELKIRLASKIAKLDRGNGGDTRQTMASMIQYVRQRTGEICKAVNYGDHIQVTFQKTITVQGIKGAGLCIINFTKQGEVLEYLY